MPHYYPIVIQSGKSLAGDSLGFHAYSLRIDNLTNQWLIEETSMAWIPPYSLGVCLRLYGTGVAIILNQAPAGQPQPVPVTGEQSVGVYSDQLRTEVAGTAVRQFTYIQAVSDLTEGPQPIAPNVGVDRLWADAQGNIHHMHSDNTDWTLLDLNNIRSMLLDAGAFRATQTLNQSTGEGLEILYTAGAQHLGTILCYDRGASLYRDLSIVGRTINIQPIGGVLQLPAGSIGTATLADAAVTNAKLAALSVSTPQLLDQSVSTAKIAANAVSNKGNGNYNGAPVVIAVASGLANTSIGADLACQGIGPVFAYFTFAWAASVVNSINQFAIMQDGAGPSYPGQLCPLAGYGGVITLSAWFATPSAGLHSYRLWVGTNAGTITVASGVSISVFELMK